jgi:chromosome partitioning protein
MNLISLAVSSLKGGVGKTTVALNLSFAFARRGIRTLLVDTDPQGAIGLSLMGSMRTQPGVAAIIHDGLDVQSAWIRTKEPNLSILPMGVVAPIDIDDLAERIGTAQIMRRIHEAAAGSFDLIVVDTPAGLGGVTRKVLEGVDAVLLPLQCEPLALRALPGTLELLSSLRNRGARCELAGIVANMSSFRDPVVLAALEEVWSLYEKAIIDTSIPKDPAFLQASRAGVPVGLLSRRSPPVATVFEKLAAELEQRLFQTEGGSDEGPISLVD